MSLRDTLRALTPKFLLEWNRTRKKNAVRAELAKQQASGTGFTFESLKADLIHLGLQSGDDVLVHSSLSKIGYIQNGPETFIRALLAVVGETGHILMPTSPNAGFQLEYIQQLAEFDVEKSPSALGKITEVFRTWPGVERSASPTEPVSCIGPNASWYVSGHLEGATPYAASSPFRRLIEKKGKILYIGVTLDNAGTSLHTLEDAVENFKFPVYFPTMFPVKIKLGSGESVEKEVKVHNPEQSALRKCDELLPMFKQKGCYNEAKIGNAKTLVFDAEKMFQTMVDAYNKNGVTMYTPQGLQ